MLKIKIYLKKILKKNLYLYNITLFFYKIINYPKDYIILKKNLLIKKKIF